MIELTTEMLDYIKPNIVFASGIAYDNEDGLHMFRTGKLLKWVAVKGDAGDWAIYCHYAGKFESENSFAAFGEKVTMKHNIIKLIACTKEAMERYRY